jgi:sigma54-dependent transcription regulator
VNVSILWDVYQSIRISQLDTRLDGVQDAQAGQEAAQRVALELDEKINRLAIICRAMFELLQASSGITEAQVAMKVQEIDERDGQADGRMTPRGQKCPKCQATMSARFGRCLFCGYRDPSASPFLP